jgi:hypothetical protein
MASRRLLLADFQKQIWATRMTCGWIGWLPLLIRRFIDRRARVWLQRVQDCPANALGSFRRRAPPTGIASPSNLLASFGLKRRPDAYWSIVMRWMWAAAFGSRFERC